MVYWRIVVTVVTPAASSGGHRGAWRSVWRYSVLEAFQSLNNLLLPLQKEDMSPEERSSANEGTSRGGVSSLSMTW
jgi:hypothetical protein